MTRLLALRPPRGRSGAWLLALGIGLVLAVEPMWPDRTAVGVAGAIGLTFLAATRWQLRWLPVAVLVTSAISLRWGTYGRVASDVTDVTKAAIAIALQGGNPYGIGYAVSSPPGAPFPYGPVDIAWYAPFLGNPILLEVLVSVGLTLYFGWRAANGRPVGLAIFALAPPLVLTTVDGSNDISAGLFILIALAVAGRRPVAGAALLAVAVAFKEYAIAWLPPLVAFAGMPALIAFAGMSVVAWSPVLFDWGVGSYAKSLAMAQQTHLRASYWSLGAILDGFAPDFVARSLETLRYVASGAVAVLGGLRVRSIDGVIVVGTVAFLVAQFGGYFGSYVYLGAIAPILCWRIDDWLRAGLPEVARAYGAAFPDQPHPAWRRMRRPTPVLERGRTPVPTRPGHGPIAHPGPAGHAAGLRITRDTRNPVV
jgi:hypothetical protein